MEYGPDCVEQLVLKVELVFKIVSGILCATTSRRLRFGLLLGRALGSSVVLEERQRARSGACYHVNPSNSCA